MPVQIAVDAMGGDYAPEVVIEGAIAATQEAGDSVQVLLVGPEDRLKPLLETQNAAGRPIAILHAPEVIGMEESPSVALRAKPHSSIHVGLHAHKTGKVQAFVSNGNTGAVMAAALFILGRLPNISRPSLPAYFPTLKGTSIVLDVGANVDCKPEHLMQFALMGSLFYQVHLHKEQPTVALLNVGEEPTKGNEVVRQAYQLLSERKDIHFIGNVEGRDIFYHGADVVVCDGFVGNVLLKFGESFPDILQRLLKETIGKEQLGEQEQHLIFGLLKHVLRRFDYAEFGGVPLLGINGTVLIGHGSAHARAVKRMILEAAAMVEERILERMATLFQKSQ